MSQLITDIADNNYIRDTVITLKHYGIDFDLAILAIGVLILFDDPGKELMLIGLVWASRLVEYRVLSQTQARTY